MTGIHPNCTGFSRRRFLSDTGMGFTGLALAAMLQQDGIVKADAPSSSSPPDGKPHFAPKAKNVIWLFMLGGASHLETFDPKPACTKIRRQDDRRNSLQEFLGKPADRNEQAGSCRS